MNDENINQGASDEHTGVEKEGNDRPADSGEVRMQRPDGDGLEKEAEGSGTQDSKPEAAGEASDEAVGDANWMFGHIWNKALEEGEDRVIMPRDYMYATELGKAPIDVYLAMKGTKPSNPPNGRSKRKFEAGNMWEWIVGLVLKRAGVIREAQERIKFQLDGMQPVSGRSDYVVGGKINPADAKTEIAKFELPEAFYRGFDNIVEYLQNKYPEGLKDKPLEIKSVSAFMFDKIEKAKRPLRVHVRQLMHYMYERFDTGHIVYICRDDCRMMEFVVLHNPQNVADYIAAVKLLSGYYQRDEMPPLERPIIWDDDMHRFTKNNLGMAYSPYLTLLYKIKDQEEFDSLYMTKAGNFNRVLKRIATGARMTDKNLEVIEQMQEMGFDAQALAKVIPLDVPDEETEAVIGE